MTPPLPSGTALELEGALRAWMPNRRMAGRDPNALSGRAQRNPRCALAGACKTGADPLLAPPIYGCWQAARHTVDMTPAPPAR